MYGLPCEKTRTIELVNTAITSHIYPLWCVCACVCVWTFKFHSQQISVDNGVINYGHHVMH